MNRMAPVITALILLAASNDSDAAFADRATLPPDVAGRVAYLTVATFPVEQQEALAKQARFIVPSLSSKSYLVDQLPVAVSGTNLLRIDLGGLGWEKTWGKVIAQHYTPAYRPDLPTGQTPLVVRADWVVAALTDPNITGDAQYQLLYGGKPRRRWPNSKPSTRSTGIRCWHLHALRGRAEYRSRASELSRISPCRTADITG